jgi:hypothetical protein
MGIELGAACGLAQRLSFYERSLRAAACRNQSRIYYTFDGQPTTEVRFGEGSGGEAPTADCRYGTPTSVPHGHDRQPIDSLGPPPAHRRQQGAHT